MKNHHLLLLALVILASCQHSGKKRYKHDKTHPPATIISGPMLGYTEHREALVWLEVAGKQAPTLFYMDSTQTTKLPVKGKKRKHGSTVKYILTKLEPSTTYQYFFEGKTDTFQLTTRDLWEHRHYPKDFSFIFGSCNYVNDTNYDRPGEPYGQGTEIFKVMAQQQADWMIWLGDNTYLREADYSSKWGIEYRYSHTRQDSNLQPLLSTMRHMATWDDHDYGANDADISFTLKKESLQTFKNYWGNQKYGLPETPGVFSKIEWNDVEFYLLDNRYYRSPNNMKNDDPDKQYLGPEQMEWLKNSLLSSSRKYSFRFIICGNQVLNPANEFECYRHYEREWQELMDFIVANKIPGVIFLSGDRHLTEINRITPKGGYTLFDITSSPLSSRAFSTIANFPEYNNPARIDSTLLTEQNFVKATISGSYNDGNRQVTFTAIDKTGTERWSYTINQGELRVE